MRHMPPVSTLRLFVKSWRHSGFSCLQILDAMTRRLALNQFDPAMMDEEDRKKYEELKDFLTELEQNSPATNRH